MNEGKDEDEDKGETRVGNSFLWMMLDPIEV
jgi:hypothetical protein